MRNEDALDAVLHAPQALLYKHSPRCGTSVTALREVGWFLDAHPTIPGYLIDVLEDRPLARATADRLGIVHESPQVILLRDGCPVWHASHYEVTAAALASAVAEW